MRGQSRRSSVLTSAPNRGGRTRISRSLQAGVATESRVNPWTTICAPCPRHLGIKRIARKVAFTTQPEHCEIVRANLLDNDPRRVKRSHYCLRAVHGSAARRAAEPAGGAQNRRPALIATWPWKREPVSRKARRQVHEDSWSTRDEQILGAALLGLSGDEVSPASWTFLCPRRHTPSAEGDAHSSRSPSSFPQCGGPQAVVRERNDDDAAYLRLGG